MTTKSADWLFSNPELVVEFDPIVVLVDPDSVPGVSRGTGFEELLEGTDSSEGGLTEGLRGINSSDGGSPRGVWVD